MSLIPSCSDIVSFFLYTSYNNKFFLSSLSIKILFFNRKNKFLNDLVEINVKFMVT